MCSGGFFSWDKKLEDRSGYTTEHASVCPTDEFKRLVKNVRECCLSLEPKIAERTDEQLENDRMANADNATRNETRNVQRGQRNATCSYFW